MNLRAAILCFNLLLALPLFARESTDVIVMRNGDHLTGQIKALNGGVLYVGLPYVIQTLSVDWSKVAHLESKQLFIVKTEDGSVYNGTLNSSETAPRPPYRGPEPIAEKLREEAEKPGEKSHTARKSLTSPRPPRSSFSDSPAVSALDPSTQRETKLSSTASADWFVSPGTLGGSGRPDLEPIRSHRHWTTSTRNQLTFEAFHLLPKENYFYGGFDGFLQSAEQGISHQNTLGGGVGYYLANNEPHHHLRPRRRSPGSTRITIQLSPPSPRKTLRRP